MASTLGLVILTVVVAACGTVKQPANPCGDGNVTGDELCDEGAANGQGCCTADCTFAAPTVVCRTAESTCDVEETCDGASAACPADVTVADGTPCTGNGTNTCSAADTCAAGVCGNNDEPTGTSCAVDACHLDFCDGTAACIAAGTQTIAIIESQSGGSSQDMDVKWKAVTDALGHATTIYPQTHLDSLANLDTATILIVSSSTIVLPQNRRDTIAAFLASGRGVYLQGEYLATYEGNILFELLADGNGAGFTWGPEITGQFNAVAAGCYATTPSPAATPFNQNFAITGTATGSGVKPVQIHQQTMQPVAFSYCRPGGGLMIVKTDQDDIRVPTGSVVDVMKNILYRLSSSKNCVQ